MFTMFISAILFGIMAFMVKILTIYLPAELIIFFRFIVGLIGILFLAAIRYAHLTFNNKPVLLFRGIVGAIAIFLYFKAVSLIPVSDAVVLQFTYPIFATIFAAMFLKEELKFSSIIALATAFMGIILISNPAFKEINIGYFYGIISAVFAGGAIVTTRQLRRTNGSWSIVLSLMFAGSIIGGVTSFGNFILPDFNILALLLGMALIATLAQLLLTYSYKVCNVAKGSTISMVTVLVTVILAVAFLGEKITLPFLVGTSLIFGSTAYLLHSHPAAK